VGSDRAVGASTFVVGVRTYSRPVRSIRAVSKAVYSGDRKVVTGRAARTGQRLNHAVFGSTRAGGAGFEPRRRLHAQRFSRRTGFGSTMLSAGRVRQCVRQEETLMGDDFDAHPLMRTSARRLTADSSKARPSAVS